MELGKIVAERHRKLARHKVPGQPSKNKIRPERTVENVPMNSRVPSGRIIFSARIQPLRSWLISAVPAGHKFSRVPKNYSIHSPVCGYGLSFSLSVSRPRAFSERRRRGIFVARRSQNEKAP